MNRQNRRRLTESEIRRRIQREKKEFPGENKKAIPIHNVKKDSFSDTGTRIINDGDEIIIKIKKSFIKEFNPYDIGNYLAMLSSPLFVERKNNLKTVDYKEKTLSFKGFPHVAVFMNNIRHYSGGRYYAVMFCKLLASIGCRVTMVTDHMPHFLSDFDNIDDGGRLTFNTNVEETIWLGNSNKNNFDLVVGVPNDAGVRGYRYAKKWNLPVYMMVFETPNYISKYRGGLDSSEGYWGEYKDCLVQCDKIICLAKIPMEETKEWLKDYRIPASRFTYLYPAVNNYIADQVPEKEEKNEITFIGRHTDFKNPVHVVRAVGKTHSKPRINFIGTHSERTRILLSNTAREYGVEIKFYAGINDFEKFTIIKRSKIVCIPSQFEGFGIPPAEALYCGKPAIVYDLPVTKDIYKDSVEYARAGRVGDIVSKIDDLMRNDDYRKSRGIAGKKYAAKICHTEVMKDSIRNIILNKKKLKISVGMICLNSEDTVLQSLRSIYNVAHEILMVEGAVEDYAKVNPDMVNAKGGSVDRTIEIIEKFNDPFGKIKVLSKNRKYKHKMEMQNIIAENVTGDIYLKVDSDEIYKESDLEKIRNEFMADPSLYIFKYKFYHFWKSLNHYAVGGQWESKMTRCWRWRSDFRHPTGIKTGFNYYMDKDDNIVDEENYKTKKTEERLVYHLNYACQKDEKILSKINYYKNRGIESGVTDTWSNWKLGQNTSPTHKGGTVQEFNGELPYVLKKRKKSKVELMEKFDKNSSLMESPVRNDIRVKTDSNWCVGMIVLNEEKFLKNNLLNMLKWNNLNKIVIVEGADEKYPKGNVDESGLSQDRTSEIIMSLAEQTDKIIYIKKGFAKSKQELRNLYLQNCQSDYLLVQDADEFYSQDDLNRLNVEVKKNNNVIQWEFKRDDLKNNIYGGIVHFWHKTSLRVVGGYYSIPHQRIYRFTDGMKYIDSHNHPTYPNGKRCDEMRNLWGKTSIICYHAGFLKDKKDMRDKQDYYYNRGEKKDKPMYSDTRELWFNWDGKTMFFPEKKIKIVDYKGFVPDSLLESINV